MFHPFEPHILRNILYGVGQRWMVLDDNLTLFKLELDVLSKVGTINLTIKSSVGISKDTIVLCFITTE